MFLLQVFLELLLFDSHLLLVVSRFIVFYSKVDELVLDFSHDLSAFVLKLLEVLLKLVL